MARDFRAELEEYMREHEGEPPKGPRPLTADDVAELSGRPVASMVRWHFTADAGGCEVTVSAEVDSEHSARAEAWVRRQREAFARHGASVSEVESEERVRIGG